jgi:hypothetical protein
MQVGPEPDKDEDPEAWADWSRRFNGAFLAAKRGIDVAGPSTLRDPTGATVQSGTSILDRIKAEREAALNYTGPASVVRGP